MTQMDVVCGPNLYFSLSPIKALSLRREVVVFAVASKLHLSWEMRSLLFVQTLTLKEQSSFLSNQIP